MSQIGIEKMNIFCGIASLDVQTLANHRRLDNARFANLMMKQKSVALHNEDPVTYAVNSARPIIDSLTEAEKNSIELVITCTESGIDFGKSVSTYVHDYLGLSRHCRVFELKQACYSGTAGFQMAVNFILSQAAPGAKALVICVDLCRFLMIGDEANQQDWSFSEPSGGAGAVAMLISDRADIFRLDIGASGYYSYEVMDTCRPQPDNEAGNADLSLMSYLDCCQQTFLAYQQRVADTDYRETFAYLAFHTPFAGMVKGAHRTMMRKFARGTPPAEVEADFQLRVSPGFHFCQRVGNIMGGTVFLSLAGHIATGDFSQDKRIGCFSYGSGCCSEFFSGVITAQGQAELQRFSPEQHLANRYILSIPEYEALLRSNQAVRFGTENVVPDSAFLNDILSQRADDTPLLFLKAIKGFHREYEYRT
ncbi:3-hydroxy-3-methylglutaryl-ACP synthase [Xenorhabdus bovienii]|uniref:hydroxymethylglutaryl-CoA synthase family protein n=1 Tax=Xenorhabdus bovienii TaxID=40576 RepID=UPI0023B2151B|nr:hydroxymethylglutaryl-CoA synthase [Xenorhabdus bovienii]MDE9482427.1 3-hydroxy-3-methylglutaryl-ACP synthase [Xenorhabdus bovienii]MDE9556303.1 3-hydroxy-3-methylglutaryl-ACP synthase [Xenorhabdus bovienii]